MAIIVLSFLLALAGLQPAQVGAEKFLDYSGNETLCETEMAHLDSYAIRVQNNPEYNAYVIAYGGRYGTARHEMKQRRERIKRYLVKNRNIEPERVRVVNGGFRKKVTVELWLVPHGKKLPEPTPTVSPDKVKYKRTNLQFTCSSLY